VTRLPTFLHEPFSEALSRSLLLPAFVALLGVIAALFLRGFGGGSAQSAAPANRLVDAPTADEPDYFPDDDDYVEYTVDWSSGDEDAPPPAPAETWQSAVFEADDEPETVPEPIVIGEPETVPEPIVIGESLPEPIGFAHNGFHVAGEVRFQAPSSPSPRGGRHSREAKQADDDAGTYGRHSMRFRD
jgi:hypothetical protein